MDGLITVDTAVLPDGTNEHDHIVVGDHDAAPAVVANAVLRIVEDHVAVPHADGVAAPPVVALDLLEAGDPRAVEAGRQLFARLVQAQRGR